MSDNKALVREAIREWLTIRPVDYAGLADRIVNELDSQGLISNRENYPNTNIKTDTIRLLQLQLESEKNKNAELSQLKVRLAGRELEISALNEKLEGYRRDIMTLEMDNSRGGRALAKVREANDIYMRQVADQKHEITRLTELVDYHTGNAISKIDELNAEITRLNELLNGFEGREAAWMEKLQEWRAKDDALQAKLAELETTPKNQKIWKLLGTIDDLNAKLREIREQPKYWDKQNDVIIEENREFLKTIAAREAEIADLRSKIHGWMPYVDISALRAENEAQIQEIRELKEKNAWQATEVQKSWDKVNELKAKIRELPYPQFGNIPQVPEGSIFDQIQKLRYRVETLEFKTRTQ